MSLFKTGLRYFLRRPLQSLLCIFGVALGVAVIVAIDLANGSASRAFELSADAVAGRATHQIIGGATGVDAEIYRRIRVDLGIQKSAPVIDRYALATDLDRQQIRILGIDVFAEPPFRNYVGGEDAYGARNTASLVSFLTRPDALLIGQSLANRYNLKPGSQIAFRIGDARVVLTVAGILIPADDKSGQALDAIALMDIGAAQALFGMRNRLSQIDLIVDERTDAGRAELERIRAILPPGAELVKPEARSQSIERLSDAFSLNLTALSLIALLVGVFLVYNTITFSVVQRRPMIGILRCLGVTRRQIFVMILTEAAILSAIGGVLGLGLGVLLGRGAVGLVSGTINDLFYVVNVRTVSIDNATLIKGFGAGVIAAMAAAILPAWDATSIPPVGALRRSNVEARLRKLLPWLALAGVIFAAVGAAMLLWSANLTVNFGGIFGVVIGVSLMTPLLTLWLMRALGRPMGALFGLIGRMSARSVANSLSRTAVAAAALMVAVSVIIGLQGMIGSFRLTVATWLETSLTADVYVRPPTSTAGESLVSIAPDKIAALRAYPGVIDLTTYRRLTVDATVIDGDWRPITLLAVGTERERPEDMFVWKEARAGGIWRSMQGRDEIEVSEPLANRLGLTPQNNRLRLRTPVGERAFTVVGVMYDYATDGGTVFIRRDQFEALWGDAGVSSLSMYLTPELAANTGKVAGDMRRSFAGLDLVFFANRELRQEALVIFDRTFSITSALNLLATLVAFIGVLSALMALQIERTRELGVLRANGMSLGQMARMTLLETGLLGGTAGLIALPTGFILAVILIYIINLRSFGWTIRMALDPGIFVQAMLVSIVSALLAAVYPMLRLRQLKIADAVRTE